MSRIQWNLSLVKTYVKENSRCELLSTTYKNARSNLKFRCSCGKEFERTFDNFTHKKTTLCQSCSNKRPLSDLGKSKLSKASLKPIEDVIDLVEKQMKCKYIDRYVRSKTRSTVIVFKCPTHGMQEVYWTNLVKRRGCPECNEYNKQTSKAMLKVERWLNINGAVFKKEYKFEGCRDKRELPFDYFLPTNNTCIEVDGRQHFEKAYFGGVNEETANEMLEYTRCHDEIKNRYCDNKGIKLIRIPYFEINNIDTILGGIL